MTLRRLAVEVKFLKAISRIFFSFLSQVAKGVHGTLSGFGLCPPWLVGTIKKQFSSSTSSRGLKPNESISSSIVETRRVKAFAGNVFRKKVILCFVDEESKKH